MSRCDRSLSPNRVDELSQTLVAPFLLGIGENSENDRSPVVRITQN